MSANSTSASSATLPSRPKYTGLETALVTFRWQLAVLPRTTVEDTFSLDDHPTIWKDLSKSSETARSVHDCIHAIGQEHNGAAKLLLCLFWSYVLKYQNNSFWVDVKSEAWKELSSCYGKPEEYLGCVENVVCKNKGCLKDIGLSKEGVKWFKVDRYGNLSWMSEATGGEMKENVIGELPTLELKLI
jgi:hypothetical protein